MPDLHESFLHATLSWLGCALLHSCPPPVRPDPLVLHCASHPSLPVPLLTSLCHRGLLLTACQYLLCKRPLKVAPIPAPCLAGKFFWYLLIVFLTLSYYTYYGMVSFATGPLKRLSLLTLFAAGSGPAVSSQLLPA